MKKLIKRLRNKKKSILSMLLAFVLLFAFNYSPISIISNLIDFTRAYKSNVVSSYYSSANETYISKGTMPENMSDFLSEFFKGSDNKFNIEDYYNGRFEELLADYSDQYLRYYESTKGRNEYPYKEFLEHYGFENLKEYYNKATGNLKTRFKSFQAYLEYFIMMPDADAIVFDYKDKDTDSTITLTMSHMRAPDVVVGDGQKYLNLINFYNGMANFINKDGNYEIKGTYDRNDDVDVDYSDDEDFYTHNNSYHDIIKTELFDEEIKETAAIYAYDGTQNKNVAGIVANGAPVSSAYYYAKNSYETASRPRYTFETITDQNTKVNKIYFFGSSSDLAGIDEAKKKAIDQAEKNNRFEYVNVSELQNHPFYYYKVQYGEDTLYIDENHPIYFKYVSENGKNVIPYNYTLLNGKEYYDVYVLVDGTKDKNSLSETATFDTLYYNTITSTELSKNSEWYVQVPYFGNNFSNANLSTQEYYFSYLYNLIGYANQDGSYFANFCKLFTKLNGSNYESRIYLKLSPTTTRKVFVKLKEGESLSSFKSAHSDYAYINDLEQYVGTVPNDYKLATNTSTERAYLIDGYEVYFEKTKVYFSELVINESRYGDTEEYETKLVANIPYEKNNKIPTSDFVRKTESKEYEVYLFNDGTFGSNEKTTVGNKDFYLVTEKDMKDWRNFYVKVPDSVKNALNEEINNGKTYEFYYRHTAEKDANQIYVYSEAEDAEQNEVFKNLNYKVLTKSEYNAHKSYYSVIKSTDKNYNKNFTLYYKYAYATSEADQSEIFVQNKISGGNAVYIIDDSLNPSEKDIYNELNYTVITTKEFNLNSDFYVLMPDNEDTRYTTLYYKYVPQMDEDGENFKTEKVVYLYSNRTSTEYKTFYNTDADYVAEDYVLITPFEKGNPEKADPNYVEGTNLYYKKVVKNEVYTENNVVKKDVFYYFSTTYTTTLAANSYYAISFYVYTNGEAQASFYVKDNNNILDVKDEHITTDGNWEQHYLFIATDSITQSVITLYLYMGDKTSIAGNTGLDNITGMVLFDNIKIIKINETDYNRQSIDYEKVQTAKATDDETDEPSGASDDAVTDEKFYDEYENLVIVNKDQKDNANFDYRTKSTIHVWNDDAVSDKNSWDNMFDFDSSKALRDLINNSLQTQFTGKVDGYSNYEFMWQYYISRSVSGQGNTFTLGQYLDAYDKHQLLASVIDESELETDKAKDIEEQKKEAEKNKDDKDKKDDDDDIPYIKSTFKDENKVLKLENKNKLISLGIVSNYFIIEQNEYYKLTVWIYSPNKNASATISVFSNIESDRSPTHGSQVIRSTSFDANIRGYSSTQVNEYGWIPISFYIEGNAISDSKCYLALEADKGDTIYFDNISIQKITSSTFDSANSDNLNTTEALSLTTSSSLITSNITNGNFYNITNTNYKEDVDYTKPYAAESWTVQSNSSSGVVAGVVPTSNNYLSVSNFFTKYDATKSVLSDPKTIKKANLYGIYAPSSIIHPLFDEKDLGDDEKSKYTYDVTNLYRIYSNSISLPSKNVYKISFNFYATSGFKGKLISNLYFSSVNSKNIISSFTDDTFMASGHGGWYTYTYYVATGLTSRTVYLELGVENAIGVCYFQNADRESVSGKTIDELKANLVGGEYDEESEIVSEKLKYFNFIDFSTTNFTIHEESVDEVSGLHGVKDYTNSNSATSKYTTGKSGVAVASYYTPHKTETYTVSINNTTYYLADKNNDGVYELYSDDTYSTEIFKIGGKNFEIISNKQIVIDSTKYTVNKAVKNSYDYRFKGTTPDGKFIAVNDVFIPASELDNSHSENVLILANSLKTDYSVLSPVYNSSLSTNSYYVLRIYVKTGGFESDYATTGKEKKFGLNITVNGISSSFPLANTDELADEKKDDFGFVCYQVLITTNTTSVSQLAVEFALGSSEYTGKGYAIIAGVEIENFANQDAFDKYTNGMEDDENTILRYSGTESKKNETEDDNPEDNLNWATFFYVFSSILLGIVLIAALVAVLIKRHPVKANKKEVNDHDKDNDSYISLAKKNEGIVDVSKESKKDKKTVEDDDEGFV